MTTKHYPELDANPNFAALEEGILQFWKENGIFEKSVENRAEKKADGSTDAYVFYDGPPFANGLPHYGHLLTGYVKDAIARYHTMKGSRVERRFGWDCHGLPAEMGAEKELGISGRAAITNYGIGKFNEYCRTSVMKYTREWEYYVTRQGRWVDFANDYKTMDKNFMESCLWAFKELYNKGLIYESMRVMPYSWAAETPVSNFETRIDNATREREDKAAYVKFRLKEVPSFVHLALGGYDIKNCHVIAWTTTPWTLPSNLALAVNMEMEYCMIPLQNNECWISNKKTLKPYLEAELKLFHLQKLKSDNPTDLEYVNFLDTPSAKQEMSDTVDQLLEDWTISGGSLLGLEYEPLFPYFADTPNAFRILDGSEFVTDGDGTGIVHMAPGFGEVDQKCCAENGIEVIVPVDEKGRFTSEIFDLPQSVNKGGDSASGDSGLPLPPRGGAKSLLGDLVGGQKQALLTEHARQMRKEPTLWEAKLWARLKGEQLGGFKFRRQESIDRYIADFVNYEKRIIVELDGSQHADSEYDKTRDAHLRAQGFAVLRFWNNEVDSNIDGVLTRILDALNHPPHQNPQEGFGSPARGEQEPGPADGVSHGGSRPFILRLQGLVVVPDTRIAEGDIVVSEEDKAQHIAAKDIAKYGLANMRIVRWLKDNEKLVQQENYKHNYPHCWRTDTPLIYRAMSSWYVAINTKVEALGGRSVKDVMAANNLTINWIPDHIQSGQMGKGIESAPDWSISRNRFWGTPIPIWKSASGKIHVCGSIEEIEKLSGVKVEDLHRPYIDNVVLKIDGEEYHRIEDVFDCWFESGSMPFAQVHYMGEQTKDKELKKRFEESFPADFITEYIAQTRGWFYTLQVLSAALFQCAPFKNVICHGVVIDEETGLKYSKRLKNYRDPKEVMDQFGADALRWMMLASPVMRGADLGVDPDGKFIRDVVRLNIKPLWSAFNFFTLYANADGVKANEITTSENMLDRYILAKAKAAVLQVRASMDAYDTPSAAEAITGFFEVLNNWYIRRSRPRFWGEAMTADKQAAYDTLFTVLSLMCRASAPLLPFVSEAVYRGLHGDAASVHLTDFPDVGGIEGGHHLDFVIREMDYTREVCNAALAVRSLANIRTRQPLQKLVVYAEAISFEDTIITGSIEEYKKIILDEVNVKEVFFSKDLSKVADKNLTINARTVGKRLGAKTKSIIPAAKKGEWRIVEMDDSGYVKKVEVDNEILINDYYGHEGNTDIEFDVKLEPKDKSNSASFSNNSQIVILDLTITPELEAEGRARDLVRMIQQARKDAGFNVGDRITLAVDVPADFKAAIAAHGEYIKEQTLAVSIGEGSSSASQKITQELDGAQFVIGLSKVA